MALLPELDKEQTKYNARKILSKYRKYKAYINAPVNPKVTASFGDGAPSATSPVPEYVEQRMINAEKGKVFCKWVDWAINSCRKYHYRELLKIVYCEGYEEDHGYYMDTLMQRLPNRYYNMSSTTYFNWHEAALLDVAERLECQAFVK